MNQIKSIKKLKPLIITLLFLFTFEFKAVSQKVEKSDISDKEGVSSIHEQPDDSDRLDSLSLDASITYGTLPNGFTYYIRHNTEPQNRVVMYLVMKAGSILETEEQKGLAHFLEHMNFNGTTNYPKNELVDYLQKTGVRFGADLNAYTSFDETVYQLPIPSDDPEIVNNGLQIMRDWAQEALLEEEEIEKERGVILEEKRLRSGAGQRMRDQYFARLLNNSRYADRMPIGTEEVLTSFNPDVIRQFHKDWYRPDLQALIVVGDIDLREVEQKVKTLFADLENPEDPKLRTEYKVELTGQNQVIIVTDPEMSSTIVRIYMKQPGHKLKTKQDFKLMTIRSLYNQMTRERFNELVQLADPPFLSARNKIEGFIGGLDAMSSYVQLKPGEFARGFKTLLTEVERIDRHGFTSTELERAKQNYAATYKTLLEEKDKRHSQRLVREYVRHFLKEEAAPGIEREYALVMEVMEEISVSQINLLAKDWIKDTDKDVLVLGQEKDKLPNEKTIELWMREVKYTSIPPYEDKVNDQPLVDLSTLPKDGRIISENMINDLGITEFILSNGMKVVLKPTDFKNDQVLFHAFSPGGHSLYPDEDFFSAWFASYIVGNAGVGPFDAQELNKHLSGKRVRVSPYISERSEGLRGSSTQKDLETMFQLTYQYFNAPNKSEEVFRSIIERQKGYLANRGDDPNQVFKDTVSSVLGNYNLRRTPLTLNKLSKIKLDQAFDAYTERFADAGDFTFLFIGSFEVEKIKPYLEQYLATLPTQNRIEEPKDLGIEIPSGQISKTVIKGIENKSMVSLVLSGDYEYALSNNTRLKAIGEILQIMLTERLRELEGGVYSPGVRVNYSKLPHNRYSVTISFGCAPDNVEKLITATWEEVEKVIKDGPDPVNLQKFVAEEKRALETRLRDNSFWLNYLSRQYRYKEDPKEILSYREELESLTVRGLKKIAGKYLDDDNFISFVLLPETHKENEQ